MTTKGKTNLETLPKYIFSLTSGKSIGLAFGTGTGSIKGDT